MNDFDMGGVEGAVKRLSTSDHVSKLPANVLIGYKDVVEYIRKGYKTVAYDIEATTFFEKRRKVIAHLWIFFSSMKLWNMLPLTIGEAKILKEKLNYGLLTRVRRDHRD